MLKAKTRGAGDDNYATESQRRRDPDATDFHAIIYINDYPQKARWKVTNKETMVLVRPPLFHGQWIRIDQFSVSLVGRIDWCVDHEQGCLLRTGQGAWTGRSTETAFLDRIE